MKKRGRYVVITATLVPEAEEVEDKEIEKEIRARARARER